MTSYDGLPDDLDVLEDRQDLSQYSYDPDDPLDTVTFPDSQQSTDSKPDVFVGVQCEERGSSQTIALLDCANLDDSVNLSIPIIGGVLCNGLLDYVESEPTSSSQEVPNCLWLEDPLDQSIIQMKDEPEPEVSTTITMLPVAATRQITTDLSDNELLSMSTRDLNRRLQSSSADERQLVKQRRRTLKNRGYAQTCRTRRVGFRQQLEIDNEKLMKRVSELETKLETVTAERNKCRSERDQYQQQLTNLLTVLPQINNFPNI